MELTDARQWLLGLIAAAMSSMAVAQIPPPPRPPMAMPGNGMPMKMPTPAE